MKEYGRAIRMITSLMMIVIMTALAACGTAPDTDTDTKAEKTMDDQMIIGNITGNFSKLAEIPRASGHEKAVSDMLKGWAEELGFTVRQNEAWDLIFDVPATEGHEDLPLTCLQAHIDMVTLAEEGVDYDPLKDPIKVVIDEEKGIMTADGTTLGGDDGIGVAMIMSLAEGDAEHGPLRVIFTTDEEVGWAGVDAVTEQDLEGVKYLINIDTEESDVVTVSSAADATLSAAAEPVTVPNNMDTAVKIGITGLLGGHSGQMIGEGRCNGIIALCGVLEALDDADVDYGLISISGGDADNAIPKKAEAVIAISSADRDRIQKTVSTCQDELAAKYEGLEDGIELSLSDADAPDRVIEDDQTEDIIEYVTESIDGVHTMSETMEGFVESSSNLGVIAVDAGGIEIRHLPRSSDAGRLDEIIDHQQKLGRENGLSVEVIEGSKPWPVKADSSLTPLIQEIYREQNGEDIRVEAIHAGLECGALLSLNPDMDAVSIGPDVKGAHSPEELVVLSSIPKTWKLLTKLLVSIE